MIRKLTLATALAAVIALPAMVQDVKAPAMATPATAANTAPGQQAAGASLTSQEAEAWISKPVYSSGGKKLGEAAATQPAGDDRDYLPPWMKDGRDRSSAQADSAVPGSSVAEEPKRVRHRHHRAGRPARERRKMGVPFTPVQLIAGFARRQ